MRIIEAISKWIEYIQTVSSNIFLGLITFSIFIEVISRYVFGASHGYMEELNPVFMVWLMFMATGILTKADRHIRMDMVRGRFKGKIKEIIDIIGYVAEIVLLAFVGWSGIWEAKLLFELNAVSNTEWAYSLGLVTLCVPIGSLFIVFESLERLIKTSMSLRAVEQGRD